MNAEQAMTEAAEAVYGGDQSLEGPALLDQLQDRGYRVVRLRRRVERVEPPMGRKPRTARITG